MVSVSIVDIFHVFGNVFSPSQIRTYSDCACVQSRQVITPSGGNHDLQVVIVKTYLNENGYALAGKCERTCGTLITFLIFLFIVTLITACAQPSVIIVTLRSASLHVLSYLLSLSLCFTHSSFIFWAGQWRKRTGRLLWECSLFFSGLLVGLDRYDCIHHFFWLQ